MKSRYILSAVLGCWMLAACGRTPPPPMPVGEAMGEALAAKAAEVAGGSGEVVLLVPVATTTPNPQAADFGKALKRKHSPLTLAGTVPWLDGNGGGFEGDLGFLSLATFKSVAVQYPHAKVIISFEGIPDPREISAWPKQGVPLIVVTWRMGREAVAYARPAAAVIIVPKVNSGAPPKKLRSTAEVFQYYFEVL